MGVRNCSRLGCQEIMCSHYITDIGYICYYCKGEFAEQYETDQKYQEIKLILKTTPVYVKN